MAKHTNRKTSILVLCCLMKWQLLASAATAQDETPTGKVVTRETVNENTDVADANDYRDHRDRLAEHLFKFKDASSHLSEGGHYLWITRTGEGPTKPAKVLILKIAEDFSKLEPRHHFELLNPVKPTMEYVTSDGKFFVTADEAGRCGNGPRDLVIYDLEQGTKSARSIDQFLPKSILKDLKGPAYMGGEGLRQWQRLVFSTGEGVQHYDANSQTFFPTKPERAKTTSKIPFLSIHLPTGKVQPEPVPEKGFDEREPFQPGRLPKHLQTDWAMADGTRKIPAGSDEPVTFIGIFQYFVDNASETPIRMAFQRDSKSGNYLRMNWDTFIKKTHSKLRSPAR